MGKRTEITMRMFPNRGETGVGDVSIVMYGETQEFELLGGEFHELAKARVAALHETRPHDYDWQSIGSNYAAIPVVYNYRHSLELYLKGMLMAAEPALTYAQGEPGINASVFARGHSFRKLLPEIERAFKALNITFDFEIDGLRTREDLCTFLEEVDHLEVRYPITTKREPATGDNFMQFNLFEFADKMDAILDTLKAYVSWIDDEAQGRCHVAHEARVAALESADYEHDPPEYYPPDHEPDDRDGE
jgi:hypothetical protein